jgi:hypothetical protein
MFWLNCHLQGGNTYKRLLSYDLNWILSCDVYVQFSVFELLYETVIL